MKWMLWLCLLATTSSIAGESPEWLENLHISGDFRARGEITDYENGKDRQRLRIRFRVGATWTLNEHWLVGMRVVTGNPDDHLSTHQTFDDGFKDFEISLDRVYIQYKKNVLATRFGKFAHPFKAVMPYNELLWDGDVQPEGMAARYEADYWQGAAGYYVMDERSGDSDITVAAAQIGGQSKGEIKSFWSVSYYQLEALENPPIPEAHLLEIQSKIDFSMGDWKATFSAQFMNNSKALSDEDTGYAAGLTLAGDHWVKKIWLQYQHLEDESVYAYLAQDDFPANKNFEGLAAGLSHQLFKRAELHLWAMTVEPIVGDGGRDSRLRLDLNVKF